MTRITIQGDESRVLLNHAASRFSDLFCILDRGIFFGLFGYADDLALLSSTVSGLQRMLDITAEFARNHNIIFSTNTVIEKSKTKVMVFGHNRKNDPLKLMYLDGKHLPWVRRIKYLGTIITNEFYMLEEDIASKRAKFIEFSNSIIQEFKYAHPSVKSAINSIYNGSVYGANLYNLESKMCQQLDLGKV